LALPHRQPHSHPSAKILEGQAGHRHDIGGGLIVELPATEQSIFAQRLANLPSGIAGAHFHLLYHNGPLPNSQRRRRAQRPKPEVDEDEPHSIYKGHSFFIP
jgi:hypothetical protein